MPTFTQGAISLLARWLISIIFVTSAYSKIFGWGANVEVKIVKADEAANLRRKTEGFCGYEWMIDSILKRDAITAE